MLRKQLIHLKHVSTITLENKTQGIITDDLPLVTRVLEVVLPYVSPQLPHNLTTKKPFNTLKTTQIGSLNTHWHNSEWREHNNLSSGKGRFANNDLKLWRNSTDFVKSSRTTLSLSSSWCTAIETNPSHKDLNFPKKETPNYCNGKD